MGGNLLVRSPCLIARSLPFRKKLRFRFHEAIIEDEELSPSLKPSGGSSEVKPMAA